MFVHCNIRPNNKMLYTLSIQCDSVSSHIEGLYFVLWYLILMEEKNRINFGNGPRTLRFGQGDLWRVFPSQSFSDCVISVFLQGVPVPVFGKWGRGSSIDYARSLADHCTPHIFLLLFQCCPPALWILGKGDFLSSNELSAQVCGSISHGCGRCC